MYYELKENELRQLERIEEEYMRKVLNTTKGCPIIMLYLTLGHVPARFEIQKMRILYLKYILSQKEDSMVRAFFNLQVEMPTKGDWASRVIQDLKDLKISITLKEIEYMPYNQFKKIVKEKIRKQAFIYLKDKIRSKGKENKFEEFSMAEYLLPENRKLTIHEKQKLFEVKNRMTKIPINFPKNNMKNYCYCGTEETMEHIYSCEILNNEKENELEYNKIYEGTISEQIRIYRTFERNMKRREMLKNNQNPCGLFVDPLAEMSAMGNK